MKNYERVLVLLKCEFGWDLTDSLTKTGKKLVMDTLKANNIIESNPDAYKEIHREKPANGLQKLLLWIDERREAIKAKENDALNPDKVKTYHWPKDGLLENLPNNLQKDKNLHNSSTIAELNKTGRECVERVEAYVQNNEKHNESLRDKDKTIESLEREVKKLNAIIKENL